MNLEQFLLDEYKQEIESLKDQLKQMGLVAKGTYDVVALNSADGDVRKFKKNRISDEFLMYMLLVSFGKITPISNFYMGLFSGNYTAQADDTAANFVGRATEFTAYASPTLRKSITFPSSLTTPLIETNEVEFACSGVGVVYGPFISSNAATNSTSGTHVGSTQFDDGPINTTASTVIKAKYTVTLESA